MHPGLFSSSLTDEAVWTCCYRWHPWHIQSPFRKVRNMSFSVSAVMSLNVSVTAWTHSSIVLWAYWYCRPRMALKKPESKIFRSGELGGWHNITAISNSCIQDCWIIYWNMRAGIILLDPDFATSCTRPFVPNGWYDLLLRVLPIDVLIGMDAFGFCRTCWPISWASGSCHSCECPHSQLAIEVLAAAVIVAWTSYSTQEHHLKDGPPTWYSSFWVGFFRNKVPWLLHPGQIEPEQNQVT